MHPSTSVDSFNAGVHLRHLLGQNLPWREVDPHDTIIAVLTVKPATFLWLIAVLEPVETHAAWERRQRFDILCEPIRAVFLCRDRLGGALRVRQSTIHCFET